MTATSLIGKFFFFLNTVVLTSQYCVCICCTRTRTTHKHLSPSCSSFRLPISRFRQSISQSVRQSDQGVSCRPVPTPLKYITSHHLASPHRKAKQSIQYGTVRHQRAGPVFNLHFSLQSPVSTARSIPSQILVSVDFDCRTHCTHQPTTSNATPRPATCSLCRSQHPDANQSFQGSWGPDSQSLPSQVGARSRVLVPCSLNSISPQARPLRYSSSVVLLSVLLTYCTADRGQS